MPARRLLFLDASRLTACQWHSGHLREEGAFPADDAGYEAFAQYLRAHHRSIFFILADVAEEGFQLEDIPYIQGRDRVAVIKRKLGQYFYGTPFSTAISLGRGTEGRRDEKMLFAALTRPEGFEPWLTALRQAEAQLAGVFSVPQVLPALLGEAGKSHPQLLLVSVTRGGLRQTFIRNGRPYFSRLTPLATDTTDEMAITANVESGKMYQYLLGQRLLARGGALPTLVLCHPAQQGAFRARCVDQEELRFEFLDLVAESRRHGLKPPPADSRSEALFLHLLVTSRPDHQFAPAAERRFYRLWRMRFGLTSAGLVVLAGCLLFAGREAAEFLGATGRTAELQAHQEEDRARYESALEALPKIPLSNDNLRALIGRYDEVTKRAAGPGPVYLALSRALNDTPKVDIDRIDWRIAASPDEPARTKASAGGSAGKPQGADAYAVAEIAGRLPISMATDHRQQLETVNAFAARLGSEPGLQVKVLTLPFEAESGKSIRSGGEVAAVEAPKFTLHLATKL